MLAGILGGLAFAGLFGPMFWVLADSQPAEIAARLMALVVVLLLFVIGFLAVVIERRS